MPRTKMLFTLGPSTDNPSVLTSLIENGMNCARLNFSHGDHDEHARRFKQLRNEARRLEKPVATLLDLTGPKLRVGLFKKGEMELVTGAKVTLTTKAVEAENGLIPVSYSKLPQDVKPGDKILLDDGLFRLTVLECQQTEVICKVVVGGMLKNRKGINLPGVDVSIPALTPKDLKDLAFGLQLGVDYVALSFVRTAEEVIKLKKLIKQQGSNAHVIAKIEKPEAIPCLEDIIKVADGVMIARGDLGVEMSPETVPTLQKNIIAKANQYGRLVITATQMLQSMMENPTPTRAEASDVANAIFDGSDAVMLSGETAAGNYPKQAALMMARIVKEAEASPQYNRLKVAKELNTQEDHVVAGGVELAEKIGASALIVFTQTGNTAKLVSRQRPEVPVIGLAHEASVQRDLNLWWGIQCHLIKTRPAIEAIVRDAEAFLLDKKLVKRGETIVILASSPINSKANVIKVHMIDKKKQ